MSSAEHPPAPLRVAIIAGSTRPGRKAGTVARWVHGIAAKRDDASYEIVDLADERGSKTPCAEGWLSR
jgi:NAD(P)H-dependent FMN reductase